MKKFILLLLIPILLTCCTSKPYIVKQTDIKYINNLSLYESIPLSVEAIEARMFITSNNFLYFEIPGKTNQKYDLNVPYTPFPGGPTIYRGVFGPITLSPDSTSFVTYNVNGQLIEFSKTCRFCTRKLNL